MPPAREFSTVQTIAVMALPLIFAIVLHEIAHGYMAYRKGDDTAMRLGRLSLNPLMHIDPFGTILLPLVFFFSTGMLFAMAKPVPVNFMALRRPKEDMVWVAAAGPGMNLSLALVSALLIRAVGFADTRTDYYIAFMNQKLIPLDASPIMFPIVGMLYYSVWLNVILAVFNLIPIPPTDGGRIVTGLLPHNAAAAYARIEPVGIILLMVIVLFDPLGIIRHVVWPLIEIFVNLLV